MSKNNGQFEKGNEIGKETRFARNNTCASKYKNEYDDMMLDYFINHKGFPTFELFAETVGVTAETLTHWCEKHPRFRDNYARCQNIQKGNLLAGGVEGRYNPQIVKFLAINNHGMSDKVVNDNTVTFKVAIPKEVDEESN